MQQGSPTLLSALEGAARARMGRTSPVSRRTTSLATNAAARFSMHPPGGLDGRARGDRSSTRVVVAPAGRRRAVPEPRRHGRRRDARRGRPAGASAGRASGRRRRRRGSHANNRAGSPESAADVFRRATGRGTRRRSSSSTGRGPPTGTGARGGAGQRRAPLDVAGLVLRHVRGRAVRQSARAGGDHAGMRGCARPRMPGQPGGTRTPTRGRAGAVLRRWRRAVGRSRRSRRT